MQVADWEAAVRFLAYVLGLGVQPSARSWDAAIAAVSCFVFVLFLCFYPADEANVDRCLVLHGTESLLAIP